MSNKRCDCIQPNYNAFTDRCMICGGYYCSDLVTTKTSPMPLPKTTQDRIEDEAAHYVDQAHVYIGDDIHQAYIAGANAEAERGQKMITDIENIIKHSKGSSESVYVNVLIDSLTKKLTEWKGAGKEVDNPCPHCGKELSRDRNLCCRECGKEVTNG